MPPVLKYILMFLLLVICQVVVFNHICLFGVAIPLVFIYFIIKLPVTLHANWAMTVAFLLGISIDIFSNTQGLNALCCTTLAAIRLHVLHLFMPRQEDLSNPEPSIKTLGMGVMAKYVTALTLLYSLMFFTIEAFAFFYPLVFLAKVICTTLLTTLILLALDSVSAR